MGCQERDAVAARAIHLDTRLGQAAGRMAVVDGELQGGSMVSLRRGCTRPNRRLRYLVDKEDVELSLLSK